LGLLGLTLASVARWQQWGGSLDSMVATRASVFEQGEIWRLFTTIFLHSDTTHLLGNSLTFAILSFLLAGYFGVLVFPVAAFSFGMLANALTLLTYPPQVGLLGASGVVYWLAGFWVALYYGIDRRYSRAGRWLRCFGFSLAVFAPTSYEPGVAYRTHAIGFALGVVFGRAYFLSRREFFRAAEGYVEEIDDPADPPG